MDESLERRQIISRIEQIKKDLERAKGPLGVMNPSTYTHIFRIARCSTDEQYERLGQLLRDSNQVDIKKLEEALEQENEKLEKLDERETAQNAVTLKKIYGETIPDFQQTMTQE